jgi:hypothetical protein
MQTLHEMTDEHLYSLSQSRAIGMQQCRLKYNALEELKRRNNGNKECQVESKVVEYSITLRTRADFQDILGEIGWIMWKDIKQKFDLHYRVPLSLCIRNYSKDTPIFDGVNKHRIVVDLSTGEIFGEIDKRSQSEDFSICSFPTNVAHVLLQYGSKGTLHICSMEIEVSSDTLEYMSHELSHMERIR